jgi:ribosomal protein S18 acetylase RimI-like enzyme
MITTIIRADASHAATIATIGKKSFRDAFEHTFHSREELFEYLERTYEPVKLAKSIRKENNIYLLAWQDGEPVGFAKLKKHSLHDQIESISQMELQKIYVLPECRGKGGGRAMLKEIMALGAQAKPDYIWLDTPTSNLKAIRLYEEQGFTKIGKHFFTIGTQTFEYHVMSLSLEELLTRPEHKRTRDSRSLCF